MFFPRDSATIGKTSRGGEKTIAVRAALCAAVALTWAGPQALAQPTGNIRSVTLLTVKPERLGDFQAAVKEYVAVVKKPTGTRRSPCGDRKPAPLNSDWLPTTKSGPRWT